LNIKPYIIFFTLISCFTLKGNSEEASATISDVESYLSSIKSIKAEFIQISSDGHVETGEFLFKKPRKVRFAYNPPSDHLVLVNGPSVLIIDKEPSSVPQRYLTSNTPLSLFMGEEPFLRESGIVKSFSSDPSSINLILSNPEKPRLGDLHLIFDSDPIAIREWILTNYSGEKVRVIFDKIDLNVNVDNDLFSFSRQISKLGK